MTIFFSRANLYYCKNIKMLYICDICEFSSRLKSNYDKHVGSVKHQNKCSDENMCYMCLSKFSSKKKFG